MVRTENPGGVSAVGWGGVGAGHRGDKDTQTGLWGQLGLGLRPLLLNGSATRSRRTGQAAPPARTATHTAPPPLPAPRVFTEGAALTQGHGGKPTRHTPLPRAGRGCVLRGTR